MLFVRGGGCFEVEFASVLETDVAEVEEKSLVPVEWSKFSDKFWREWVILLRSSGLGEGGEVN